MLIKKQNTELENILYNNILLLSRNKLFYTKFNLSDSFQNRIHLIFIHICFLFIKIRQSKDNQIFKHFYQNIFDLIFNRIELNLREIGHGDVAVNKNMKYLVKTFYNVLINCETYKDKNSDTKKTFLCKYLDLKNKDKTSNIPHLIDYFDKYRAFCFDLSSDSVLRGELNFKY